MLLTQKYNEVVENLFQRKPIPNSKNLQAFQTLLHAYGNPQNAYPCIHIAGTNGKGQVSVKIAAALQYAGYKVGVYISPHVFTFTERISINGEQIPEETIVQYHVQLDSLLEKGTYAPNFFECITLYAFRYFKEQNVDVAVLETGVGGLLDATNVVHPLASVITSISYDHMEYLGETLEEIAEQKAGIIKPNIPVVIGPHAQYASIFQRAKKMHSPLYVVEEKATFYDTENQWIAKETLRILKKHFSALFIEHIHAGLLSFLPCRFEKRGQVLYDVAHNPDGFKRLANILSHQYPKQTFRFLIGMSLGKDVRRSLEQIEKKAHFIHFVQAKNIRSISALTLATIFKEFSNYPCSVETSVLEGLHRAKHALKPQELLIVCGSFYIMAEAKEG